MLTTITFALIAAVPGCSGDSPAAPSRPNAPTRPALTITTISPAWGRIGGGTEVTIMGAGFRKGVTVTFGGTATTDIRVINATVMTAIAPPHAEGEVDVVVMNAAGQSSRLTGRFSYLPDDFDDGAGDWDY